MDITYDYYKMFYYVVKYGSFSKAAKVTMRSQPNITKMMNNLENQLGCKLLVRSNRGVTLTTEGERLFAHVEIAMEHFILAENELQNGQGLNDGSISISTTEVALYGCVLSAISRFKLDYPNVKIKLTNQNNTKAIRTLKNGLADFAVVTSSEIDDSNLILKDIKNFREILCCKNGYKTELSYMDIKSIENASYISLNDDTYTYHFLREYLFGLGVYKEPDISVATVDQILPIVKSGIGIGFISEFIAKDALASGEIVEIPLKNPPPIRKICLALDKKRPISPAARKFIEYLG